MTERRGRRGFREHPRPCWDVCPDSGRESCGDSETLGEGGTESQEGRSVILMVTFTSWDSWVAAISPPPSHH